jgi:hypothetical protein
MVFMATITRINDIREGILQCDSAQFREQFNRSSFEFAHHLSGHRLFEIPRLIELAKQLSSTGSVYYDAGEVRVDQRWDQSPPGTHSVDETIRRIQDAGAWIILRRAEQDPEYCAVLEECMAEVQSLLGKDLKKEMLVQDAIVFITSPHRVTAYHIDRECNFILQVHGNKDISVFDRNDRDVLPEEEIERFWMVDNNAAVYKERYQNRATVYSVGPGMGIHVPVNAPHWVRNKNDISVTLSVNFQFREDYPAHVYRANYLLRKVGIKPKPPGLSKVRDRLKCLAMNATYVPIRGARRFLRG